MRSIAEHAKQQHYAQDSVKSSIPRLLTCCEPSDPVVEEDLDPICVQVGQLGTLPEAEIPAKNAHLRAKQKATFKNIAPLFSQRTSK